MPGGHSNPGFVDLAAVRFRKGFCYSLCDFEIGTQIIGRGALCQLDQPSRVSHQHRLISRCDLPELVEHVLKLREPIAGAARSGIPQPHTQELETPDHIQVEQRVRVTNSTIATRPTRLLPQMKDADHHLRRIDEAVMQSRKITRPESTGPMRFFRLTSRTRLAVGDPNEEAILEVTRQNGTVSQIFVRFSLGVQQSLYSLDDVIAMGQEELEKFDRSEERRVGKECRYVW